jgi:hypothetical protein
VGEAHDGTSFAHENPVWKTATRKDKPNKFCEKSKNQKERLKSGVVIESGAPNLKFTASVKRLEQYRHWLPRNLREFEQGSDRGEVNLGGIGLPTECIP